MDQSLKLLLSALAVLASGSSFAATTCLDCDPPASLPQAVPMTREMIKAARDKFDTNMKSDTKRPWDRPTGARIADPEEAKAPSLDVKAVQ